MQIQPWKGFECDGCVYQCRHFLKHQALELEAASTGKTAPLHYYCDSTACATLQDGETFCACSNFVSSVAKLKARSKPRRKKAIPVAQMQLFPPPETTPTMDVK